MHVMLKTPAERRRGQPIQEEEDDGKRLQKNALEKGTEIHTALY